MVAMAPAHSHSHGRVNRELNCYLINQVGATLITTNSDIVEFANGIVDWSWGPLVWRGSKLS